MKAPGQSHGTPSHSEKAPSFEGLTVAVAAARDADGEFLIRALQRWRIEVRHLPPVVTLPANVDVVFCDYAPDLADRLPWPPGAPRAALIVIVSRDNGIDRAVIEAATPNAVLTRPFCVGAIEASLLVAHSQFRYEQRLRGKVAHLEESLVQVRAIERAKKFIMAARAIGDDEAYKYIRTEAMQRRMAVGRVAEAINTSFEMFGGNGTPGAINPGS